MKLKIFYLLTVIVLLLTLTGCSGKKNTDDDSLYDLIIDDRGPSSSEEMTKTSVIQEESPEETSTDTVTEPEISSAAETESTVNTNNDEYTEYWFRTKKLRDQHYEKHGIEMGFASADDYRKAASDVVNDPDALHKTEKEDGDDVYYLEDTNDFVIVSKDGYLRTYFRPDKGKAYYDRQ